MGNLFINAIHVNIITDKGVFGQKVKFANGLNVIRAENTSGKTTLINSIIYALGFERLLSNKTGPAALKPVLKSKISFQGSSGNVLNSFVAVELQNSLNAKITIRRQIIGEEDVDLVKVYSDWIISEKKSTSYDCYYLNREGSAQREKGFHCYLQHFLDIDLPLVPRYQGSDILLYLECIMPLMFIEQVRGWTAIQAITPRIFGIQDVNKTVIEYLLKLDVQKNKKLKDDLLHELNMIQENWKNINKEMRNISTKIGFLIRNTLEKPTILASEDDCPKLCIESNGVTYSLSEYLIQLREHFIDLQKKETVVSDDSKFSKYSIELEKLETFVIMQNAKNREINSKIIRLEYEVEESKKRIEKIQREINRHRDLQRIITLGGEISHDLLDHLCPVCKQHVPESLISNVKTPMTIEENMKFLDQQRISLNSLVNQNEQVIVEENERKKIIQVEIERTQKQIISIKRDLYKTDGMSESLIREKIITEQKISDLENFEESFNDKKDELLLLSDRYKKYKAAYSALPDSLFSEIDILKIEELKKVVSALLARYDYRSTSITSIEISKDNYLPVSCEEGFELSLDSSASDSIRIIWAYTLALATIKRKFDTNHFGLFMMDEPEQQKMKNYSSLELYKSITDNIDPSDQCIITTSESKIDFTQRIKDIQMNYIELGDCVFKPESEWLL